jgi:hypothetical protein
MTEPGVGGRRRRECVVVPYVMGGGRRASTTVGACAPTAAERYPTVTVRCLLPVP